VRACRSKGLLWRTEQTYRAWARRFAAFLAPRGVRTARGEEVRAFLTHLATTQRASFATQRQALNALVFFYHEGLSIELGDISKFVRAEPRRRVPVVLSRSECRRVMEALSGTSRLMAQLAYRAGLRVMELVRLRVQDVDLERGIVVVRSGKRGKDRPTPLPDALRPALSTHLERLRTLYQQDRSANLPGVWLPEGLARKFGSQIGREWVWQWFFVPSQPKGHPAQSPFRCAPGPVLNSIREPTISALRAPSRHERYRWTRRPG
jgi:integrase